MGFIICQIVLTYAGIYSNILYMSNFTQGVLELNPEVASRPRVGRWGTYYNKTYSAFKKNANELLKNEAGNISKLTGNLRASYTFHRQMPKSWSKKKRAAKMGTPEDSNRDLDNYIKAIQDALEGFAFENDNQVVQYLNVAKVWGDVGYLEYYIEEI